VTSVNNVGKAITFSKKDAELTMTVGRREKKRKLNIGGRVETEGRGREYQLHEVTQMSVKRIEDNASGEVLKIYDGSIIVGKDQAL